MNSEPPRSLPQYTDPCLIGMVGTFPPTACGLATFTENVHDAALAHAPGWSSHVVRLVDSVQDDPRTQQWVRGDPASARAAAEELNHTDVVLLQHEFGIFGGPDGDEVLALLDQVRAPVVTVLHTVLEQPSTSQRRIVDTLVGRSSRLVVLSDSAARRLVDVYGVEMTRIDVIPHGAAANVDGPRTPHNGQTMLTWGLLGPGKGIEHGIDALATLSDHRPELRYVVAGRTHPNVQARDGEAYRDSLIDRADRLGIADRVVFDDDYRSWEDLRQMVRSTDLVLLPYDSTDQVTSGVLVEAIASAKPVVATRFPHAVELLGGGAGAVVVHGDPLAMAAAIDRIVADPATRSRMSRLAWDAAQPLLWPAVGARFVNVLGRSWALVAA